MTTPKNAPKKGAATRGPRLTAAEVRRREETQRARDEIALMGRHEVAGLVTELAMKQPAIFDHELLLAAANHLNTPSHAHGGFIGGAPMRLDPPKFMPVGGQQVGGLPPGTLLNEGQPFTPPGAEGAS